MEEEWRVEEGDEGVGRTIERGLSGCQKREDGGEEGESIFSESEY